jgi:alpha(1,3/1,4) fucosyltransferase
MTAQNKVIHIDFCDLGPRRVKTRETLFQTLRQRYNVELSTSPDYLVYTHGTSQVHRLYSCKKIYWTSESDLPDFRRCDYALTSRYLDDPRHLRLPFYIYYVEPGHLIKQPDEWRSVLPQKQKFCAFFTTYANRKVRTRTEFFQKLSRRKRVDSAGKALNNIGYNVPFTLQAKQDFLRPYKFYMAFENDAVPGYVTEKLVEGMRARCIPIYYGSQRVAEDFNPKSFLNYHDFPSEEALIERILEIDQNEELYRQYLNEPFFHGNQPSIYYDPKYVLDFFEHIFNDPTPPVAARSRFFGRWTLVKQNKPHQFSA